MSSSLFVQAIDEAFPKLDAETRAEINDKVTGHMLIIMKEKVFAHDQERLERLHQSIKEEVDDTK